MQFKQTSPLMAVTRITNNNNNNKKVYVQIPLEFHMGRYNMCPYMKYLSSNVDHPLTRVPVDFRYEIARVFFCLSNGFC